MIKVYFNESKFEIITAALATIAIIANPANAITYALLFTSIIFGRDAYLKRNKILNKELELEDVQMKADAYEDRVIALEDRLSRMGSNLQTAEKALEECKQASVKKTTTRKKTTTKATKK